MYKVMGRYKGTDQLECIDKEIPSYMEACMTAWFFFVSETFFDLVYVQYDDAREEVLFQISEIDDHDEPTIH